MSILILKPQGGEPAYAHAAQNFSDMYNKKAFPDIVPYPKDYHSTENGKGYDDRSDFWTLEYRGRLRKKIMEYAHLNDIMSPTDCGTMTHWYSRTPVEFLEKKKPLLLTQADNQYIESVTGCVFDFRKKENMDYYMQLTKTMADEYDCNNALFHTIGLGERRMYKEDKKNFMLKQFCYRRIAQNLRQEFPNSKLMLASWDFVGWWRPEEVQSLIDELDPERTIILDYTSEGSDDIQNFTSWGIVGKFPWIFGLFHAYESESELRGPYDLTKQRLKIAADDPYCKGMILWPELSHSDPVVLEYLSENAWSPLKFDIEEIIEKFCRNRYGIYSEEMNCCWQAFLPFMKQASWGGYTKEEGNEFATNSMWLTHNDMWVKPLCAIDQYMAKDANVFEFFKNAIPEAAKNIRELSHIIKQLADINERTTTAFIRRDSIDIVRTVCGRFLNYMLVTVIFGFCDNGKINKIREKYFALLSSLSELVRFNTDFSLYESLKELEKAAPVNPNFERTLKQNILNWYCRQCCSELIDFVFKDEAQLVFDWASSHVDINILKRKSDAICANFFDMPLLEMQRDVQNSLSCVMSEISRQISELTEIF